MLKEVCIVWVGVKTYRIVYLQEQGWATLIYSLQAHEPNTACCLSLVVASSAVLMLISGKCILHSLLIFQSCVQIMYNLRTFGPDSTYGLHSMYSTYGLHSTGIHVLLSNLL